MKAVRFATIAVFTALCACSMAARAKKPSTDPQDPFSPPFIDQRMKLVCDWQLTTATNPKKNDWVRAAFYTGEIATYHATKAPRYLDRAIQWGIDTQWSPNKKTPRDANNQCCGATYAELFMMKRDPTMIAPTRAVIDSQMAAPKPGRVEWWWCDALYMAPPTLARLSAATGDDRYIKFMDDMWWDTTDFLYDKNEHLFFRDQTFFNAKTKNGKKVFWSRGNGWVFAGTVRVLQYLPPDYPSRPKYVQLFRDMAEKLASIQGADGFWRSSLLDPEEFPNPESSGTAFDCFAITWGINNGLLDRDKYLPAARKAWLGLNSAVTSEGKLGYVQKVAGGPGPAKPEDTHEYAVGAFLLAGSEILKLNTRKFDMGSDRPEPGYLAVLPETTYTKERGFGWTQNRDLSARDRRASNWLLSDFVSSNAPAKFRTDLPSGHYRMSATVGDMEFGNHVLRIRINGSNAQIPPLRAGAGEFVTMTTDVNVTGGHIELTFDSPGKDWALNALTIEPSVQEEETTLTRQRLGAAADDIWKSTAASPDPTVPFVQEFRENLKSAPPIKTTGLTRDDYLKLIAGDIDFFKRHQNADGAIIDPYKQIEWQYSTPCFATGASALVKYSGRKDLVEPAAKAMDWATSCLNQKKGATAHEDFYAPTLAHAIPLLKPFVSPRRAAKWEKNINTFDPFEVYRAGPGGGNWNVVALSGEILFHKLGLRKDLGYVGESLDAQAHFFSSPWGLYREGPMPYDHFPRLWAADALTVGYDGPRAKQLAELLRRGALTSLFMQSPSGELPTGGRSAHHQWNEAEQCVTYEIYAAKNKQAGDVEMAGVFKRAAHLALGSMKHWIRPSGELWIVKNRFDPAERHGYEGYSADSQYNLLPMAMLVIAYEHAGATEDIAEKPAPADVGGYVMQIDPFFHKIFANAGGTYVELDTAADPHYNATGLLRVHASGANPQLGPSDALTSDAIFEPKEAPRTTAAIGVAWKDTTGRLRQLAEYSGKEITSATVRELEASPARVAFAVDYDGYFAGPQQITEHYVITPSRVEMSPEVPGTTEPLQITWPVLLDDGRNKVNVETSGTTMQLFLGDAKNTFRAEGANGIRLDRTPYLHRNGWSGVAWADWPAGTKPKLVITPGK